VQKVRNRLAEARSRREKAGLETAEVLFESKEDLVESDEEGSRLKEAGAETAKALLQRFRSEFTRGDRQSCSSLGMALGMASKKVTVTIDEEQLDAVRRLVHSGAADTISGFIQHAVGIALNDVAGWGDSSRHPIRAAGPRCRRSTGRTRQAAARRRSSCRRA
jgi:hypothetical protein